MLDDLVAGVDRLFELARQWAMVDDADMSGLDALNDAVFAELQRTPPHLLALLALSAYVDSHRMRAIEEIESGDPVLIRAFVLDALERDQVAMQLRWRTRS
jgi:hypothetical protein